MTLLHITNYTVELFRPDDEKLLKRTVHVHRLQPYNAKALTTDLAEFVSRVPGTLAPERVLAHSGSTVDDVQFYIQWHGIPSESTPHWNLTLSETLKVTDTVLEKRRLFNSTLLTTTSM